MDLIAEMTRRANSAIIFPRGFGKSTWEKIDSIHDIVYATEPVILYVSVTLRDAGFHFESIKGELENNEKLIRVYGNLVPSESNLGRKWTNTHFETTNHVNMVARGAGKGRGVNIRNQRPTKIILDDIEDDDSVRNPELREKIERWINGVIMPSRDPIRGFVKMIGTILHPEAALVHFFDTNGGLKRAAIENDKSIWPEVWSMERLMRERNAIGSLIFNQEYMGIPITGEARLVKESWIRRVPKPLRYGTDGLGNKTVLIDSFGAIDPAISEKETADYTALATAWRNRESGQIIITGMDRGHLAFPDQVSLVFRKQKEESYDSFGIETVAYQKALRQEIDRRGPTENIYVPTREITLDRDKVRRLMGVLPFIENGTVVFSQDLPEDFFAELMAFPNGQNDDQVDAMVHVINLAMEGGALQSLELL